MARNPDISALAAYAGKYEQQLYSTLINSLDAVNQLMLVPNVKNKLNLTKLTVKNGIKPYTGNFVSQSDDLTYTPRVLEVDEYQRDITVEPKKYRTTFMAEQMGAGSGSGNKTIPFAGYTLNEVMKGVAADLNDSVIGHGFDKSDATLWDNGTVYNSGDYVYYTQNSEVRYFKANTTTTAGDSPDSAAAKWDDVTERAVAVGFLTRIADEITAANLAATATGAIDNTSGQEAVTVLLELFRAHTTPYKRAGVYQFVSDADWEFLLDDLQSRFNQYVANDVNVGTDPNGIPFVVLPKTARKCIVQPATWLNGSRRILCTPRENLLIGTDLMSDHNEITTDEHIYTLDMGITGLIGTQIRDLEAITVNDQA